MTTKKKRGFADPEKEVSRKDRVAAPVAEAFETPHEVVPTNKRIVGELAEASSAAERIATSIEETGRQLSDARARLDLEPLVSDPPSVVHAKEELDRLSERKRALERALFETGSQDDGGDKKESAFTVKFVDIERIHGLDELLREFPMQFIPRKEEIGRILALAKHMHSLRVERGEVTASDPITITDVGGANAALGKLVTDLAKENGIAIAYTIVDPHTATIKAAEERYIGDTSLVFVEKTAREFNLERTVGSPAVHELISKRDALIREGEAGRRNLNGLIESVEKEYEHGRLDAESISAYADILQSHFNVDVSSDKRRDRRAFYRNVCIEKDAILSVYVEKGNEKLRAMADQINAALDQERTTCDLVINSWMPGLIDFTEDIREVNGAAILYAIGRGGDTGIRSDERRPQHVQHIGEEESYHPGDRYHTQLGWISHSTPFAEEKSAGSKYWQYGGGEYPTFHNGFIVQTQKATEINPTKLNPAELGIEIRGRYPWEKELAYRGGPVAPVAPLKDDPEGHLKYAATFDRLEKEMVQVCVDNERKVIDRIAHAESSVLPTNSEHVKTVVGNIERGVADQFSFVDYGDAQIFGVVHTKDAKSATVRSLSDRISSAIQKSGEDIYFLVEGMPSDFTEQDAIRLVDGISSEADAVERYGEKGALYFRIAEAARLDKKIKVSSFEPEQHELGVDEEAEDVALYLILRQMTSLFGRADSSKSPPERLMDFVRVCYFIDDETDVRWIRPRERLQEEKIKALAENPQAFQEFLEKTGAVYLEKINSALIKRGLVARPIIPDLQSIADDDFARISMKDINELHDPSDLAGRNSVINRVAQKWNAVRDRSLVRKVGDLLARGEKPFVICGTMHAAAVEGAVKDLVTGA